MRGILHGSFLYTENNRRYDPVVVTPSAGCFFQSYVCRVPISAGGQELTGAAPVSV